MTAANSPDNDATALSILRTLVATGARAAVSGADMMEKGLALGISKASGAAKQVMSSTATDSPDLGDVVQRLTAHVHDGVELLFSAISLAADAFTQLTGAAAAVPAPVHIVQAPVRKKIAILGGGVAGMSAAHELAERGYEVEVYEAQAVPGGKARSTSKSGTGKDGRADLPGEHGFRFFPGFYRHVTDTMARIPYPTINSPGTVFGNLVEAKQVALATAGSVLVLPPANFPNSWADLELAFQSYFQIMQSVPTPDTLWFINRLLVIATSCEGRGLKELEAQDWWNFTQAQNKSLAFQKFYATGMTRCAVACRAEEVSARSAGSLVLQLLFKLTTPGARVDQLLNGPTSEVWLTPWLAYLRKLGVSYLTEQTVIRFECDGKRITGVVVCDKNGVNHPITADYYIAAIPAEKMKDLVAPLLQSDPGLAGIRDLTGEWMNGVQFFLKEPLDVASGHVIYFDSEWALTSISQGQFWSKDIATHYGDGTIKDILSVDISDWDSPGKPAPGYGGQTAPAKPAKECTEDEIRAEVLYQIGWHEDQQGKPIFRDLGQVATSMLDDDIVIAPGKPPGTPTDNREPLLVNVKNSWAKRPKAITGIPNLFLASDYVQTNTDVATMEGANEAARAAVNGILDAAKHPSSDRCMVWPLGQPNFLVPLRAIDERRFAAGQKNLFDEIEFTAFLAGGGKKSLSNLALPADHEEKFRPGIEMHQRLATMFVKATP